jgi:hypothetical protein
MNDASKLWTQLLRLDEPWVVTRCETHGALKRHDLWIALEEPRSWFGFGRKPPRPTENRSWRHVNFGDWQVHLHVTLPQGADLSRLTWAGEQDQPFTRALSQRILALLKAGCDFRAVGELLEVAQTDVWRFRYFLDHGRWSGAEPPQIVLDGGPTPTGPVVDDEIPAASDPVWLAVLEGRKQLDVRVLGLKLLLTRLRAQLNLVPDKEVRQLKVHEFHRYFSKNRHLLAFELDQIRGA